MSDGAAREIAERLGQRLGLIPHDRFIGALLRAEPDLVRRRGKTLPELTQELERDPELYLELAGLLSVGETFFLRHSAHFEVLVRHVAGRLSVLPANGIVKIWSAGCSSGEEPYSIAIAIHMQLGADALSRVQILATDVDPRAIEKAQRASYRPWSFRGAPAWLVGSYFRSDGSGAQRLAHAEVLEAIRFEAIPIQARASMLAPDSLDVVFFRNVAIYLLDETRASLHREMHRVLREDGLLVQGPSDPLPDAALFGSAASQTAAYGCYVVAQGDLAAPPLSPPTPTPVTAPTPRRLQPRRPARSPARPLPRMAAPRVEQVTSEDPSAPLERALLLAERGDLATAWEAAEPLLSRGSTSASARYVRGKILLAARALDDAIEELRAAVYLDPGPLLPRYWYASTLHAAKRDPLAVAQLRELDRRLTALPESETLDDGETRAAELLASVHFLMEAYR